MTPAASTTAHPIRLPATLAIGFTGHRALDDEAKCRKSIFEFLEQRKASTPGLVYGISSVAAGGDLLFAESCIQLALPLCVLLPLPEEEFRKDFDETSWARAELVLKKAASVEVIGGNQSREERYYECGIETVQRSRLLLALWNGDSSQGLGGTEDIVTFAKGVGKPVVWLHDTTGDVRVFNEVPEKNLMDDPELDFLNGLPDPNSPIDANRSEGLARAWFQKVDENATRSSPQVRRLATIPIVCTAAASLSAGAASWASNVATWSTLGGALGIMAPVLPAVLRLKGRQALWVRTRTAAEVCRSVLAFWNAPGPYEAIGPEVVPELAGVLMSLNLLKILEYERRAATLEEFKKRYREERMATQISYFFDHAAQSGAEARRYRAVIWVFTTLAILASVWLFVGQGAVSNVGQPSWGQWLALGSAIAFQIATVTGAVLAINDCDRRRKRYQELHQQLGKWDAQMEALRTWPSVLRVAGQIERALLAELLEWRSLIRNQRLAKK